MKYFESGEEQSRPDIYPPNGKKQRSKLIIVIVCAAVLIVVCSVIFWFAGRKSSGDGGVFPAADDGANAEDAGWEVPDYVSFEPIKKNEYSRPCTYLSEVSGVVVHYVANPGTSAANNRSYFEGLSESHTTYASSHFIIGLEGEVLQLIPLDEWAYCSNERNSDTISIECCHPEEDGKFTDETYASLIKLLADLCREFNLNPMQDIIRHYDVTGKMCPLYYVEHEDLWVELCADVAVEMTPDMMAGRKENSGEISADAETGN